MKMSDTLKKTIHTNRHNFADNTSNLEVLLNLLVQNEVLHPGEATKIKGDRRNSYEQNTELYITLSKKGDDVLPKFLECLKNSGNKYVLKYFQDGESSVTEIENGESSVADIENGESSVTDIENGESSVTERENECYPVPSAILSEMEGEEGQPLIDSLTQELCIKQWCISHKKHILSFGILLGIFLILIVIFICIYEVKTTHITQATQSIQPTEPTKPYSTTTWSPTTANTSATTTTSLTTIRPTTTTTTTSPTTTTTTTSPTTTPTTATTTPATTTTETPSWWPPNLLSGICTLHNSYYNQYMYASNDDHKTEQGERRVFTWIPGNVVYEARWKFESVIDNSDNQYFRIRNTVYLEYLCATTEFDPKKHERRNVYTQGKADNFVQWKIEQEKDSLFAIKNIFRSEYLYAASDPNNYDSERRRVFTWISGEMDIQGRWNITCTS